MRKKTEAVTLGGQLTVSHGHENAPKNGGRIRANRPPGSKRDAARTRGGVLGAINGVLNRFQRGHGRKEDGGDEVSVVSVVILWGDVLLRRGASGPDTPPEISSQFGHDVRIGRGVV